MFFDGIRHAVARSDINHLPLAHGLDLRPVPYAADAHIGTVLELRECLYLAGYLCFGG